MILPLLPLLLDLSSDRDCRNRLWTNWLVRSSASTLFCPPEAIESSQYVSKYSIQQKLRNLRFQFSLYMHVRHTVLVLWLKNRRREGVGGEDKHHHHPPTIWYKIMSHLLFCLVHLYTYLWKAKSVVNNMLCGWEEISNINKCLVLIYWHSFHYYMYPRS